MALQQTQASHVMICGKLLQTVETVETHGTRLIIYNTTEVNFSHFTVCLCHLYGIFLIGAMFLRTNYVPSLFQSTFYSYSLWQSCMCTILFAGRSDLAVRPIIIFYLHHCHCHDFPVNPDAWCRCVSVLFTHE